jgi:hypothetical protein
MSVDFDKQLDDEIKSYVINKRRGGFGVSQTDIYSTGYSRIVAFALHIPNSQGEIKKIALTIRKYARPNYSSQYELKDEYDSERGSKLNEFKIDLESKSSGDSVRNLAEFLNAQYKNIGIKLNDNKVVIDNPENIDIDGLIKSATINKKELISNKSKISLLREYKSFLVNSLVQNEKYVQDWLDEDGGRYRKQRCLIFGLEYTDHIREGELQRKRFDVLARSSIDLNEYTLIELKSPSCEVFSVYEEQNKNGGKSTKYSLSDDLARAIPQILQYRKRFEVALEDNDELQRLGVRAGKVSKCLIVIGERKADPIWKSHYDELRKSLASGLEILTYTDLINKISVTIKNLES